MSDSISCTSLKVTIPFLVDFEQIQDCMWKKCDVMFVTKYSTTVRGVAFMMTVTEAQILADIYVS